MNIASRGAGMAVAWEQRIDFARLRRERPERARAALAASDLGALLLFDPNNIRYVTSTHIGECARDKLLVTGRTHVRGADVAELEARSAGRGALA
jgi:hypothetical protein